MITLMISVGYIAGIVAAVALFILNFSIAKTWHDAYYSSATMGHDEWFKKIKGWNTGKVRFIHFLIQLCLLRRNFSSINKRIETEHFVISFEKLTKLMMPWYNIDPIKK